MFTPMEESDDEETIDKEEMEMKKVLRRILLKKKFSIPLYLPLS